MKTPYEVLRNTYLHDLTLPDPSHNNKTKVKNPKKWSEIQPFCSNSFIDLSEAFDRGRKIYCWSDLHIGHKNIIKYSNRPFPNPELMNQCLIGNYLNMINHDDIVIFGGDIGFMSETNINGLLDQLPGYKIQIIGNHDMHRDGKLYDLNFNERHLCLGLELERYKILFTHYPMTHVPKDWYNMHGHTHTWVMNSSYHINMCVEHTSYKPKLLQSFFPGYNNDN